MSNKTIMETQATLKSLGFDPKGVDGIWGKNSEAAFQALVESTKSKNQVTWGSKLQPSELKALQTMINSLGMSIHINDMMACMAFESGGTFSPAIQNKSTQATGVIQIMPANAIAYGTTVDALKRMTFIEQLKYVAKHFAPYAKRIKNLQDTYASILWPRAIGKPENYPLWTIGSKAYMYNDGLDLNKDGKVTMGEALTYIKNRYVMGCKPGLVGTL